MSEVRLVPSIGHWPPYGVWGLDWWWRPEVEVCDPNGRDGEWYAVISLPHEVVEWEGYGVPAFEGDAERIEWERRRRAELRC